MSFLDEINQVLFGFYSNPLAVLVQLRGKLLISVITKRNLKIVNCRFSCSYVTFLKFMEH